MSVDVAWRLPDAIEVAARLADRLHLPRPDVDAREAVVPLAGGSLRLVRAGPGDDVGLEVRPGHERSSVGRGANGWSRIALVAVGWATVELDRGVGDAAARLRLAPDRFVPASDDRWLGARTRVAPGGPAIVVLEPATEGRLAAALARHGEGPVAIWVAGPAPVRGTVRDGPFGPATIAVAIRPWGPFILEVAGAATPGTIGR
jgi:hypothetical protein